MKFNNSEYFSCYSPKLKEYLDDFDFEPIEVFVHLKTGKTCWVYRKTEKLIPYLETWTKNKDTNSLAKTQ